MSWKSIPVRSLKTRVTLFTLAIFLICIWALAIYSSRTLRADMQRLLSEQQFSSVALIAGQINDELDYRLRTLEKVAVKIGPDMMRDASALKAFLEASPALYTLFTVGNVVFDTNSVALADFPEVPGRAGKAYEKLSIVRAALDTGRSSFGKPILSKTSSRGDPIIGFGVPIRDAKRKVIGVLAGVTNLGKANFLSHITESRYGTTGGYHIVVPRYRLVVTATDKRLVMTDLPQPGAAPLIDRFVAGYEGSGILVDSFGVEVLASAKQVPVSGWYVSAALPTEEAFAPIRIMQQHMFEAAILLTLLAGALTWWMIGRQLSPMLAAAKTLANLAVSEQPPQPLRVDGDDEVGQLIRGFNHLLESLKQRGKALQESEARFRNIFEDSGSVMLIVDPTNGEIVDANPAASTYYGYSLAELTGMAVDRINASPPSEIKVNMQLALRKERNYFNFSHRIASGELRDVDVYSTPITIGGRELLVSIVHDVTERKQTENALREASQLNKEIIQSAREGVIVYGRDLRYRVWNAFMEQLSGKAADDVLGRHPLEVFPFLSKSGVLQKIERALAGETPETIEFPYTVPSTGRTGWASDTSGPLRNADGEIIGVLATVSDITERRQIAEAQAVLEVQLRESQKMEAIGTLAGGIAHDFNNLLAAILGNAALASEDMSANPEALTSLREIEKAARRARNLVQHILTFSRRHTHELTTQPLRPPIEDALGLLRATLPAGVELATKLSEVPLLVACDANQIAQVLMNLCTNAWHALSTSAGRIEVGLEPVRLDEAAAQELGGLAPGDHARLWVRDEGSGMDAVTQARMFDPFFTTKPVGRGTGLGLSVVHGIVKSHLGAIKIESTPGKGTTVAVYLPISRASAQVAQAAPEDRPARGTGQHVLYLDDEEAMVLLVQRMLERLGYRVSGYTGAREALEAVRAAPKEFDLVVSDFNMPEMSGLEMAGEIRCIRPDLPVVITSGYVTAELRVEASRAGVREVIHKANTVEELCRRIAHLVSPGGARTQD